MRISRRAVLGGIGQSAALGALAASLPPQLRAAQAAAPAAPAGPATTYCLATVFGKGDGAVFNSDAFRDTHLPLMQKAYGKSASRIELRVPAPGAAGAAPSEIIATVNIWFTDAIDFAKHNSAAAKELASSMAYITKAPSSTQVDQVLAVVGDDRQTVPVDDLCLSTYFPSKEGATIDSTYFAETFYPKLAELYGAAVVRRVEVTGGAAGSGGAKPTMLNSAHIYIRDDAAFFDTASEPVKAALELSGEAPNHTNIKPMQTLTRVHAAA